MTDIITNITGKKDWKTKSKDEKIVSKWKKELIQQGGKAEYIDIAIDVAHSIIDEKKEYEHLDWHLRYCINPDKIKIKCKCECNICEDVYESGDSDHEKAWLECKCNEPKLVTSVRHAYLKRRIHRLNDDVPEKLRTDFIRQINRFRDSFPADYHPGSNEMVRDIIHPSLYCYVKGVSKTDFPVDPKITLAWIPTDFSFNEEGSVVIDGYINNLPKENKSLYKSIPKIFEHLWPGFQQVITKMDRDDVFCTPGKRSKILDLQVIVKVAEINLSPEKPSYPGGSWHLEGTKEENIIATGIYYYDIENIKKSYLGFRSRLPYEGLEDYPQNGFDYVKIHYGIDQIKSEWDNADSLVFLGKVKTVQGLSLVFPNYLQHYVYPFELDDKTEPGHRSIIAFFLVDPKVKVVSTADIEEQQDTMTFEDAKIYREMLMFQRKNERQIQETVYTRGWSLCEH